MDGVLDETVAAVNEVEGLCGKLKTELLTQFDETHKRLVDELKENQADREGILLEEIALLRVEHQQMRGTVEALTAKNKELLKFKSKLELERANHEKTCREKQELEEALSIAKGYRRNAVALDKERKELCLQLDVLRRKLQGYGGGECEIPSRNPGLEGGKMDSLEGVAEESGSRRLMQEHKELKEAFRLRERECQIWKGQCAEMRAHLRDCGLGGPSREAVCSGVGSNLRNQLGKPSEVKQNLAGVGGGGEASLTATPCNVPGRMEKENRGSNEDLDGRHSKWSSDRVEFYRGTLSTDIGSSKKRRVAEERERLIEWGTQMGVRRANDGAGGTPRRNLCQTPPSHRRRLSDENQTPRRQTNCQSAGKERLKSPHFATPRGTPRSAVRGGVEFDPTLPCTFAESLDLTQMTEPASPGLSEGAASTLNVDMGDENAEMVFSPVRLSQTQPSLEGNVQSETPDPPQACEARVGVLGGRRAAGTSGNLGGCVADNGGNRLQVQEGARWNSRANNDVDEMDCVGGFEGVIDMTSEGGAGDAAPSKLEEGGRVQTGFKYDEVVRKRADREKLPGFDCVDCRKFYEAMSTWGNGGEAPACGHAVQKKFVERGEKSAAALLCDEASRHRKLHGIPNTPQGFWDLDFPNSVDPQNP